MGKLASSQKRTYVSVRITALYLLYYWRIIIVGRSLINEVEILKAPQQTHSKMATYCFEVILDFNLFPFRAILIFEIAPEFPRILPYTSALFISNGGFEVFSFVHFKVFLSSLGLQLWQKKTPWQVFCCKFCKCFQGNDATE